MDELIASVHDVHADRQERVVSSRRFPTQKDI